MRRARALALFAIVSLLAGGAGAPSSPPLLPAAAVAWPPSTGLLIAEVVTGGTSASDEYLEVANASVAPLDLVGLEVVYVTSSGATVTRKASWNASRPLEPGQRLLIANVLGVHSAGADATYSGGLAATGGALVLRAVGGAPVDAVGWGDAANTFVEGTAAPAPPAGSSIERRPGNGAGNAQDTNDNAEDWLVRSAPVAEGLAAAPMPVGPGPSPTPTPTPVRTGTPGTTPIPTVDPSPTPTAEPTATASAEPPLTPEPSADPTVPPSPDPTPTPGSTPAPTATPGSTPAPTATPAPSATPTPSPLSTASPTPAPPPSATPLPTESPVPSPVIPIALARGLPDGAAATVEGTLTTALGALEAGRGGFLQDASGGIALWLAEAASIPWEPGTAIRASGVVDDRYGQRTLRVATADLVRLGTEVLPLAVVTLTGVAGELVEGSRVEVEGTVTGAPDTLSDGLGVNVDDGSGALRVVVGAQALADGSVERGDRIRAVGPLGQRDSSGSGTSGYRVCATLAGDFAVLPPPAPSPEPTPTEPGPTVGPTPTASSPAPSPAPVPDTVAIATARLLPVGTAVAIAAVLTAESGRLGSPGLAAIQDATAGLVLHLPGDAPGLERGDWIGVRGTLAAPYGQLELRVPSGGIEVLGCAELPDPMPIAGITLSEAVEGRLVAFEGRLDGSVGRTSSGDLDLAVRDDAGRSIRFLADTSSGIAATAIPRGERLRLVGVVGQRATGRDRLDGYRVWLRDGDDIDRVAGSGAPATPASPLTSSKTAGPTDGLRRISIDAAASFEGRRVELEGVVSVGPGLLDSAGRRVVVADERAAIAAWLPTAGSARVGERLRLVGEVGRSLGALRLDVDEVESLGTAGVPEPVELRGVPQPALEWRLVRAVGRVAEVHRLGDRWLAEVLVAGKRVPVLGLTSAGLQPRPGVLVTVIGVVRRPYPTAADRRYSITPRSSVDLVLGPLLAATAEATANGPSAVSGGRIATTAAPHRVDLADLADRAGQDVMVGGLIADVDDVGVLLDDGTARVPVILRGEAAVYLRLLEPGDAIEARGRVELAADGPRIIVEDPAALVQAAALDVRAESAAGPTTVAVPGGSPTGSPAPAATVGPARAGLGGADPGTLAGAGSLAGLTLASVAVTLIRRRRGERLLAVRVAARLRTLRGDVERP